MTPPDAGELNRRRDLVIGYMPQMFELDETATVHDNILAGAQRVLDLIEEYERLRPRARGAGFAPSRLTTSTAGISSIGSRA